jgi:hypothetical protein
MNAFELILALYDIVAHSAHLVINGVEASVERDRA